MSSLHSERTRRASVWVLRLVHGECACCALPHRRVRVREVTVGASLAPVLVLGCGRRYESQFQFKQRSGFDFDTYKLVKSLMESGFTQQQAETLTNAIAEITGASVAAMKVRTCGRVVLHTGLSAVRLQLLACALRCACCACCACGCTHVRTSCVQCGYGLRVWIPHPLFSLLPPCAGDHRPAPGRLTNGVAAASGHGEHPKGERNPEKGDYRCRYRTRTQTHTDTPRWAQGT